MYDAVKLISKKRNQTVEIVLQIPIKFEKYQLGQVWLSIPKNPKFSGVFEIMIAPSQDKDGLRQYWFDIPESIENYVYLKFSYGKCWKGFSLRFGEKN